MTTAPAQIEQYLHAKIPLSREMAISVISADRTGVRLAAPLMQNINHQSTAFGGSISTLAILAAWTYVDCGLRECPFVSHVVIQRNSVEYLRPVRGDFQAFCAAPPEQQWRRFIKAVTIHGKGRIRLGAELVWGGEVVGTFQGEYVALREDVSSAQS